MKILFNTYPLAFQNPGGGEVIIQKLYHHLKERKGVTVDFFNQWAHHLSDYDIIHHFSSLDWQIWDYYSTLSNKFVLTPTLWPATSATDHLKHFFQRSLNSRWGTKANYDLQEMMNRADRLLPTTQLEAQRIHSIYKIPREKMNVVANGIDLPLIVKEKFTRSYALFVGQIRPNKNLDIIIKACLQENLPLKIVGGVSPEYQSYWSYCQSLFNAGVEYLGRIENNSPLFNALIADAYCTIVASDRETCSIVGLESGARGTPVIMTSVGGTREIFADQVEYITPKSLSSLTAAIQKIQHWDQKRAKALSHFITSRYGWDTIADQVMAVYREVLNQGS